MPTPSDTQSTPRDWAAKSAAPKRSVFGNYRPAKEATEASVPQGIGREAAAVGSLETALARAFIYRYLAKAFEDPTPEGWDWITKGTTLTTLQAACSTLAQLPPSLSASADFESFQNAYLSIFGHAARGSCPLNEIEYGDIKADPLFQPHRLAGLAAFYRAFGLEVAADAGERHDHLCLQLEFMCVLAVREAYAIEQQFDAGRRAVNDDAQRNFLREHLGRWAPAFARRLVAATEETVLRSLASFLRTFIESECSRFSVRPGSEDLLLRPVDEAAESQCASCGINAAPPGALAAD